MFAGKVRDVCVGHGNVAAGGAIKVVTDQKDIRKNECVTVEQSGNEANIRRASPEVCKPGSKVVVEQLKPEFQEEADESQLANTLTGSDYYPGSGAH